MRTIVVITLCLCILLPGLRLEAQTLKEDPDSVVLHDDRVRIVLHTASGAIDYHFAGGIDIYNAVGYVLDTRLGLLLTSSLAQHPYSTDAVHDSLGDGVRINIRHMDDRHPLSLVQRITLYASRHWVLTDLTATGSTGVTTASTGQPRVETRNISPLAILPSQQGRVAISGSEPRI